MKERVVIFVKDDPCIIEYALTLLKYEYHLLQKIESDEFPKWASQLYDRTLSEEELQIRSALEMVRYIRRACSKQMEIFVFVCGRECA